MNISDAITVPIRGWDPRGESRERRDRPAAGPELFDPQLHVLSMAVATMHLENDRLARQLRASREQVRRLSRQVVEVQEQERLRMSRELHDEAGQALTALKFSLAAIRENLADPEAALSILDEVSELTDQTTDQIRRLAHDLRPTVLDRYPFEQVLEGVCGDFARRTRLEIDFDSHPPDGISEAGRVSLYRFLQETLTNVAKHARASRIRVRLTREGEFAVLTVSDDGIGFNPDREPAGGAGLIGLQERFELLGGWTEIVSEEASGACIRAGIPLTKDEKETDR